MKKFIMTALAFGLASALWAASTTSFTYQAALRDEHGNPIKNGETLVRNFHVKIRLWDRPMNGELLWGRTFQVMTDDEGLFNLEVSDEGGALPNETAKFEGLKEVFLKQNPGEIYVGLEVDGSSGEIVPRQRLLAVPYAAVADDVRGISNDIVARGKISMGDGNVQVTSDGFVQGQGSSTLADVVASGDVTVGGRITTKGGLTVEDGKLVVKTDIEISKEKKLMVEGGTLEVNADLALSETNKLMVGGKDVVPVPVGGIIMWTSKDLPDTEHWAVCDGKDGIPDLRDRFIVGAGNSYTNGATGGEATHTLSIGEMPSHNHGYRVTAQGYEDARNNNAECVNWDHNESGKGENTWETNNAGGDSEGNTKAHENRPPYYALYYIMRIK